MQKTLKTRIQCKHDTPENWDKATNFIPLVGEIIIYDRSPSLSQSGKRIKVGDGETLLSNLPYVDAAKDYSYVFGIEPGNYGVTLNSSTNKLEAPTFSVDKYGKMEGITVSEIPTVPSGVTAGTYGSTSGATFNFPKVTVNAEGKVTAAENVAEPNSGVTAGTYPSAATAGTITVPNLTINAKGKVTTATTNTYTISDNKVQTAVNTASTKSYVTTCPGAATGTLTYHEGVYVNHSTGVLFGAAWNDYAEYRETTCSVEPGRVVCENNDDTLSLSTQRLQPGAEIVSDTFGFAIGETEKCKTPIATSGRVLAYPYEDRNTYQPGDPVCAGPKGTVSKMSREEIKEYPDRMIGTVSAVPSYETWGEANVPVNGRIWIRIR